MTPIQRMLAGCGAVLLGGIAYAAVSAQGFYDYRTYFTVNRAVELPGGRTLQPGKYVFRQVNSSADRHIVQVLDEDEVKVFATILAVEPRDEALIFADAPASAPRPIRYWYHSRRAVGPLGYEFVYPKEQATRIANVTNQRVLMTDTNVTDGYAMIRAQVRTVDPNGRSAVYRETVRPQTRSTSAAVITRDEGTPVLERFDVARTGRWIVAAVQSLTLIGVTMLGAALVALRLHSRASRWSPERPFAMAERTRGFARRQMV